MKNLKILFTTLIMISGLAFQSIAQNEYSSLTPSNMKAFNVHTDNSEYDGHSILAHLTDGDPETSWRASRNSKVSPLKPETISYEYDEAVIVKKIELMSTHSTQRVDDPKHFYFLASNGGDSWDTLYTQSDPLLFDGPMTSKTIEIENDNEYSVYQLVITAIRASYTKRPVLAELQMYGEQKENITPFYITTKSNILNGHEEQNLVDNDYGTYWKSSRTQNPSSNNTEWVQVDFLLKHKLDAISLTNFDHAERRNDPKAFNILGKNEGDWDTLLQVQGLETIFNGQKETKTFELEQTGEYRYYRIDINAAVASYVKNVGLSEIEFVGISSDSEITTISHEEIDLVFDHEEYHLPIEFGSAYMITSPGGLSMIPSNNPENGAVNMGDMEPFQLWDEPYWHFDFDPNTGMHLIRNKKTNQYVRINDGSMEMSEMDDDNVSDFLWSIEKPLAEIPADLLEQSNDWYQIVNPTSGAQFVSSTGNFWNIKFDPVSTNPNDPYVPPHLLKHAWQVNRFDWSEQEFNVVEKPNSSVTEPSESVNVNSPFYTPTLDAIASTQTSDNPDSYWQEGWEMLRYNFGHQYAEHDNEIDEHGNGPATANIQHVKKLPYMMMYNKYRGIVRVFSLVNNQANKNSLQVRLSFTDGGSTHLLGGVQGRALNSIPNDEMNMTINLPQGSAGVGDWTYADFNVSFDPCTPMQSSNLQVHFESYNRTEVTLSGLGMSVQEAFGTTEVNQDFLFGEIDEESTGIMVLEHVNGLESLEYSNAFTIDQPGASGTDIISQTTTFGTGTSTGALNPHQSGLTDAGEKIIDWYTPLGQFTTGIDFAFFLVNGLEDGQETGTLPPPRPYVSYSEIRLQGNSTSQNNNTEDEFSLSLPGSQDAHNGPMYYDVSAPGDAPSASPLYNQPLGIFNILHQPELNLHIQLDRYNYDRKVAIKNLFCTTNSDYINDAVDKYRMRIKAKPDNQINFVFNETLPINWNQSSIQIAFRAKEKRNHANAIMYGFYELEDQFDMINQIIENFEITTFNVIQDNLLNGDEVYDRVLNTDMCDSNFSPSGKNLPCVLDSLQKWSEPTDLGFASNVDYGPLFLKDQNGNALFADAKGILPHMKKGDIQTTLALLDFDLVVVANIVYDATNRDGSQISSRFVQSFPYKINPFIEYNKYTGDVVYATSVREGNFGESCLDVRMPEKVALDYEGEAIYGQSNFPHTKWEQVIDATLFYHEDIGVENNSFIANQNYMYSDFCQGSVYQANNFPSYNISEIPCFDKDGAPVDCENAQGSNSNIGQNTEHALQSFSQVNEQDLDISSRNSSQEYFETAVNAYPNPTSGDLNFDVTLSESGMTHLKIVNLKGQAIRTISSGYLNKGLNNIKTDISDLHSGVYLYQLIPENDKPIIGKITLQ